MKMKISKEKVRTLNLVFLFAVILGELLERQGPGLLRVLVFRDLGLK